MFVLLETKRIFCTSLLDFWFQFQLAQFYSSNLNPHDLAFWFFLSGVLLCYLGTIFSIVLFGSLKNYNMCHIGPIFVLVVVLLGGTIFNC